MGVCVGEWAIVCADEVRYQWRLAVRWLSIVRWNNMSKYTLSLTGWFYWKYTHYDSAVLLNLAYPWLWAPQEEQQLNSSTHWIPWNVTTKQWPLYIQIGKLTTTTLYVHTVQSNLVHFSFLQKSPLLQKYPDWEQWATDLYQRQAPLYYGTVIVYLSIGVSACHAMHSL